MTTLPTLSDAPAAATFADVIAPVTLDAFFSEYWNRRPLHVPGDGNRFKELFDRSVFERLLPGTRQIKAGFRDRSGWYTDLPVSADQVKRLTEANMTICAGVLPPHPPLAAFISSYRRAIGFSGEVYFNAYMSPDGSGFSLHLDDHPVFILQIEGTKRWWVSAEVDVPDPPRSFSFPPGRETLRVPWGTYRRPPEDSFLEVTLDPGDLLYVPAGAWHRTQAIGFSLALTMASGAMTPLDLARMAIAGELHRYPALSQRLWGGDARSEADGGIPPEQQQAFDEAAAALRDWASQIDAQSLYRYWRNARDKQG